MKVAIDLPPAQATQLETEAKRLGVSVEELAGAAVTDLLAAPDAAFQAAATRVLARDLELYRRLAWIRYRPSVRWSRSTAPFWPPPGAPKASAIWARSSRCSPNQSHL